VDSTFNMISVDGETSTNDMVLALANAQSDVGLKNEEDKKLFEEALRDLCQDLAMSIARDGEGASKLITVNVTQAPSLDLARESARWITTSPLIKSAVHGEDPNWGRIMVRLGQCGVPSELFEKLEISIQNILVFKNALPQEFDRAKAREALQADHVEISVKLGEGSFEATAWGCDLTKRYVEINTEYS